MFLFLEDRKLGTLVQRLGNSSLPRIPNHFDYAHFASFTCTRHAQSDEASIVERPKSWTGTNFQDAALASGAVVVDALFWIVLGIFGVIYS